MSEERAEPSADERARAAAEARRVNTRNKRAAVALLRAITDGRELRVRREGRVWHVHLREAGGWDLHNEGEELAEVVSEMAKYSGGRLKPVGKVTV